MVLVGPGGAGKGTVASRLVASDPHLWLSRSWTTRAPRSGEAPDAYVFVDRAAFEARAAAGGFLEWTEFLGNLYGTPIPEPPAGTDVLLEIDLDGAQQVVRRCPGAQVILLLPPSAEVQTERLRARGDDEADVQRRLVRGREEAAAARHLATAVVVNDQVDRAVAEVAGIVDRIRSSRLRPAQPSDENPEDP